MESLDARPLDPAEAEDGEIFEPASRARVLVVEDHEIGLELTCMMVQRLGALYDKASDGFEALTMVEAAAAAAHPYGLVLMDFMMPVVDGVEATRRIRAAGHTARQLPVIAVTASAEHDEIARFMAAGGQAYLAKPITLAGLQSVFRAWLPEEPCPDSPALVHTTTLRDRYDLRKWATFEAIDAAIVKRDCSNPTIANVRDMIHKLAGTAGCFGDEALSLAAAQCEADLLASAPHDALLILKRHRGRLASAG